MNFSESVQALLFLNKQICKSKASCFKIFELAQHKLDSFLIKKNLNLNTLMKKRLKKEKIKTIK